MLIVGQFSTIFQIFQLYIIFCEHNKPTLMQPHIHTYEYAHITIYTKRLLPNHQSKEQEETQGYPMRQSFRTWHALFNDFLGSKVLWLKSYWNLENWFLEPRSSPKSLPENKILVIDTMYLKTDKIPLKIMKFDVNFNKSVLGSYESPLRGY